MQQFHNKETTEAALTLLTIRKNQLSSPLSNRICRIFEELFSSEKTYNRHYKLHFSRDEHRCPYGKNLSTKFNLTRHKQTHNY